MNERIRELAKQHGLDITIDGMGYGEGNIEGLAELIVRECAEQAYKEELTVEEGMWRYRRILEHFGVEE